MGLFEEKDDIMAFLKNIIRCGKVSSIDSVKCTARVVFEDDDNVVSYDLPVLQRNALRNKDYAMPDIGEDVVCVFLPIGGVSEGFIVGSFYAGVITPPENTENYRTVIFADGTRVRYDRDLHELSVEIEGTTIFANRQDITVNTPNNVTVTAANAVIITGQTAVTVNTQTATINAPTITLNGDVSVTGNVTAVGDVIADATGKGVSLKDHKHKDSTGGITTPPQ